MPRRSPSPVYGPRAAKRRARPVFSYAEDSDQESKEAEWLKESGLGCELDDGAYGAGKFEGDGEIDYGKYPDAEAENGNDGGVGAGSAAKGADDDDYTDTDTAPQRSLKRKERRQERSDDSDFHVESASELEDDDTDEFDDNGYLEKLREKQFIATDDENGDDEDMYYSLRCQNRGRNCRRNRNLSRNVGRKRASSGQSESRSRKRAIFSDSDNGDNNGDGDEVDGDNSIQQEIQDLYDSSPDASPMKHKLREKKKRVDYTIPSLLTVENEAELYAQAPTQPLFLTRGKRPVGSKNAPRKLLYPTAGPFGGSDVQSILGLNIPPGGVPVIRTDPDGTESVVFGADSDSSDEDIVNQTSSNTMLGGISRLSDTTKPVASSVNPMLTATVNNNTVVGAQALNKTENTLSDTDPLGVDMNIDFSAVGGLDNYIDQLKEMVALPLLYPELYQNFLITPPRGVLFHGPPGTGKTLMARALAASCSTPTQKITFFMRKGADCLSKWVGEAERQLRLLFEEAKNLQPSIIFFDEIDGLAPVRSSKQEQIHASIVSTLLALMDGMDNRGQVIVIGATNRPDSVDPALRRPGRFDREFYFPLPDLNARKQILKIHTKKWTPPLSPVFIEKIAALTKGYGGADLRALCTEAALNSIQRKYPQIYLSSEKLVVNPSSVYVVAKDFIRAVEKIIPSSARSTSTGSAPLPQRIQPLLQDTLNKIKQRLNDLLPGAVDVSGQPKMSNLEEALYLDPTINDPDGGFGKHELLRSLESSCVCKPHLLIYGDPGAGQQYLGAAILNLLEGFQVQNLDLASVFSDNMRTPELFIVQTFVEARRHQPLIVFISNIDTWFQVMPHSAKAILAGLLRNLRSDEKILLLGIADRHIDELDGEVKAVLGHMKGFNSIRLDNPLRGAREQFFAQAKSALFMKPFEFLNDLTNRPKRKLKQLKVAPKKEDSEGLHDKRHAKDQAYQDKKLKNVLKIKLAGMLDLFKNRYKRFKKPIIDEGHLVHLFDPLMLTNLLIPYEVAYVKSEDPEHPNVIQELATGNFFYNMDLDTVEERVWNGYYSEATQFLKDLNMIVKDSKTSGDRDRILKAKEMFTNAQFAVDEINNPEFANACREVRDREVKKQEKLVAQYRKLQAQIEKKAQAVEAPKENDGERAPNGAIIVVEDLPLMDFEQIKAKKEEKQEEEARQEQEAKQEQEEEAEQKLENAGQEPEKEAENEKKENEESGAMNVVEDPGKIADSESETEETVCIDYTRELIVPDEAQQFFDEVVRMTDGFAVEALEHVSAKLMEIIWEDRNHWDKTRTVARLRDAMHVTYA